MENIERAGDCITLHPGFQDVCLNQWVLEVASLNLKTKAGKSYRAIFSQGRKMESERVNHSMIFFSVVLIVHLGVS